FAEMNEEEQQTVLKMIALAAAIGPASVVLGGLTTTVGGLAKGMGGLAKLLGKAGGAGLIGRIGLLGMSGPVGLAVAGIGALGGIIYTAYKNSKDLDEINYDVIESMKGEIDATDELITRFEELQTQNMLSNDEMLR